MNQNLVQFYNDIIAQYDIVWDEIRLYSTASMGCFCYVTIMCMRGKRLK